MPTRTGHTQAPAYCYLDPPDFDLELCEQGRYSKCPIKALGDTPYFTVQRKDQKTFPPQFWKQLYPTATTEWQKATDPEHPTSPDMTKCSLAHLSSYVTKTLLGQGLLLTAQTTSTPKLSIRPGHPELHPMTSFVLGLSPPHGVLNIKTGCIFCI